MGKVAPNAMIDASLNYVAACDLLVVCSAEPSSYADATASVDLADQALTSGDGGGDFTIADDTSGRKLTMTAKSAIPIDHSGSATHIALCKTTDTSLRYVTTCTSQSLTSGGTVDVPLWKINIQDPT